MGMEVMRAVLEGARGVWLDAYEAEYRSYFSQRHFL